MDGYCDWCEQQATRKRGSDDICDACDDEIEERLYREWEAGLSRRERHAWRRARDANVD